MWRDEVAVNQYGTLSQQCVGKCAYLDRDEAKDKARAYGQRWDKTYKVYRCQVCGRWHLSVKRGHDADPTRVNQL